MVSYAHCEYIRRKKIEINFEAVYSKLKFEWNGMQIL